MAFSRLTFYYETGGILCDAASRAGRNIIDVLAHVLFDAEHMRSVSMAE
jgi:hypothetical protein